VSSSTFTPWSSPMVLIVATKSPGTEAEMPMKSLNSCVT
jgi:hypothetical protein